MSTWSTRRERYGETGHPSVRVSRIRFRQKPLRTRGKVAIVARETLTSTAAPEDTKDRAQSAAPPIIEAPQ